VSTARFVLSKSTQAKRELLAKHVRFTPSYWQTSSSAGPHFAGSTPVMLAKRPCPWAEGSLKSCSNARVAPIHVASFLGCSGRSNGALSRMLPSSEWCWSVKANYAPLGNGPALPMQYLRDLASRELIARNYSSLVPRFRKCHYLIKEIRPLSSLCVTQTH
jgi:hypothetical protein